MMLPTVSLSNSMISTDVQINEGVVGTLSKLWIPHLWSCSGGDSSLHTTQVNTNVQTDNNSLNQVVHFLLPRCHNQLTYW